MTQVLVLLGKLAGLVALIVMPLILTFWIAVSHVTFPTNGIGSLQCYSSAGKRHAC